MQSLFSLCLSFRSILPPTNPSVLSTPIHPIIPYSMSKIVDAVKEDAKHSRTPPLTELKVDGWTAVNDSMLQLQADLLGIPVGEAALLDHQTLIPLRLMLQVCSGPDQH